MIGHAALWLAQSMHETHSTRVPRLSAPPPALLSGSRIARFAVCEHHFVNQKFVACVQLAVVGLVIAHLEPPDFCCVITRMQHEQLAQLILAMEVHCSGLHPGIVSVPRVIDVASKYLSAGALGEELFGESFEGGGVLLGYFARLLGEFALESLLDLLSWINHAARDGPLTRVLTPYRDHLQWPPWLGGVVARHNRICSKVGAPLSQHAAVGNPRAATRVERPARGRAEDNGPIHLLQLVAPPALYQCLIRGHLGE